MFASRKSSSTLDLLYFCVLGGLSIKLVGETKWLRPTGPNSVASGGVGSSEQLDQQLPRPVANGGRNRNFMTSQGTRATTTTTELHLAPRSEHNASEKLLAMD